MFASQDLDTMRDSVFFDGPETSRRLSRFWLLLSFAAVIAAAGVVADSTATVIGAMIVAPLMVPIQGTSLAVVIGDRSNMARCLGLVIAGAAAAIVIGYLVGVLAINPVVAETNSQVAARVSPRLIDLLAALATGAVGAIALARRDISETLPGVAIAISLVPPLTVVGLTLESGEPNQAVGALLLFATNVAAILATGTIVMAVYGVHRLAMQGADATGRRLNRRNAVLAIVAMIVVVGIPLTVTSVRIARDTSRQADVKEAGDDWADDVGWELVAVATRDGDVIARFEGPTPVPDVAPLRELLADYGIDVSAVKVELLPRATIDLGD